MVRLGAGVVGDQIDWARVVVPCCWVVEAVDLHRTVSVGPLGVVLRVFPGPVLRMDGVHLAWEEPVVSWAWGLVEGLPEGAGSPVGLQFQMVGSIWWGEEEWISLHPCRTGDWYSAGLEKPISMVRERTVNSVVVPG